VFNINGEVIGIAVAQLERAQNINFAIPVKTLETLLQFKSSYAISLGKIEILSANQNTGIDAVVFPFVASGIN
jgi:S1-C subfamily serine protease